jgi:ZIP family zinc transporter
MTSELPYWTACLYGVLGAGAIAIGGGLVGKGRGGAHEPNGILTGMGAGFLISLGALSALPEACARSSSLALALGVALTVFVLVLLAHRAGHRRNHAHDKHGPNDSHEAGTRAGLSLHDARLAVAGLALHSLLDGVAVSAALASHRELGIFVAIFVVLHKVPEGAAAAALVYASGGKPRDAQRGVIALALATALGALTIFAVGPALALALSIAAGVTAGVGVGIASHLVKHHALRAALGISLGAVLFIVSEWLLHA